MDAHPVDCPRCRTLVAELDATLTVGAAVIRSARAACRLSRDERAGRLHSRRVGSGADPVAAGPAALAASPSLHP